MPDVWVERPRTYPYRCAISGRSKPEDGPYFEFDMEFQRGDEEPSERLIISEKYLLAPFRREGASVRVLPETEYNDLIAERDANLQRAEQLDAEILDLQRQLDAQADTFARARVRKQAARRRAPRKKSEEEK